MLNKYRILYILLFFSYNINSSISCDLNFNINENIKIEDSLLGLKILTGQKIQLEKSRNWDIDNNDRVHIPEILYPLLIKSKIIKYEIHNKDACDYLLMAGRPFGKIENLFDGHCISIFPDSNDENEIFFWKPVPFVNKTYQTALDKSIEDSGLSISIFGSIYDQIQRIGSFNLSLSLEYDINSLKVSGNGTLQIVTYLNDIIEPVELYLFDLISNIGIIDYVKIQGLGENSFIIPWWPEESREITSEGASTLQISVFENNNESSINSNFEIVLSTINCSIFFYGINEQVKERNNNCNRVFFRPFINISAGHNQYNINILFSVNHYIK